MGLELELTLNEVTNAERKLGFRLAMSGSDKEEYMYRLEQSNAFAGKILSSPFTRIDTEIIYKERWISSVGYCLPVTQFFAKQCENIQRPCINPVVAKMEFNLHFPRAVVFGPKKYQGKHIDDYGVQQYLSHLERFVVYLHQDGKLGDLIRIQMDQHQQVIGS